MELDLMAIAAPRLSRLKTRSAIWAWDTGMPDILGRSDFDISLNANAFSFVGNFSSAAK